MMMMMIADNVQASTKTGLCCDLIIFVTKQPTAILLRTRYNF